MAEPEWEKTGVTTENTAARRLHRWKFLAAGLVILGAAAYLLLSSTAIGARYYVTVDDLLNDPKMLGKTVRVSGAVVGDPSFNPDTQALSFTVANIPNDNGEIRDQGGLAAVLHKAVEDPEALRMKVVAYDKEIPDLLQSEAQAIMSGKLVKEGDAYIFHADEITLKCPTRYSDQVPDQVVE